MKRIFPCLELFVDTLQTVNRGVERADLVGLYLYLLFEVRNFAGVGVSFRGVLSFELILQQVISQS